MRLFFPKKGSLAAHLRGMRPAPTSKKDNLMLRKNSNTNTILTMPCCSDLVNTDWLRIQSSLEHGLLNFN